MCNKNENFGQVRFPIVNDDYKVIDEGITNVHLIVYDNDALDNISEHQTHLFLDGVFVSDDCLERPKLTKDMKDVHIDELIDDQIANDDYNNFYFPNFTSDNFDHNEIVKYLSIPLIASIRLGTCNMTFECLSEPKYWSSTYDDLSEEGKNIYDLLKNMHDGKEIRILTFVNNII